MNVAGGSWNRNRILFSLAFLALAAGIIRPASAQWLSQSIPLKPGWNPVYLEVQPATAGCDELFTNSAVESVWMFNKRYSTVEFDLDPSRPFPEPTHWLVWLPPASSNAFLRTLYEVQGAQAYLIKVASNSPAFSMTIKGKPVIPSVRWIPQYYNFVGFPVNPVAPPTFAEFFSDARELEGQPGNSDAICTIGSDGHEHPVRQTHRFTMTNGVAYWVKCGRPTGFTAPVRVRAGGGQGLSFSPALTRQTLYVDNVSPSNTFTVRVKPIASETPPVAPLKAGDVPLSCYVRDASNAWAWADLPAGGITSAVAPGATWELQLRLQTNLVYSPDATYQSLLEVTDAGQSLRYYVPVVAGDSPEGTNASSPEGLWVGEAAIGKVSRAALGTNITWDTTNPTNTASEFTVRLIVHVNSNGLARFMQKIMMSWVTNDAGRFALWTEESKVPAGAVGAYRISSVAFPPGMQVVMAGSLTNQLAGSVTNSYNDPSNPFKHAYHPDHDNLTARFEPHQVPGIESWTVSRAITLDFDTNGVEAAGVALRETDSVRGVYKETIEGLMRAPVYIEGPFELRRLTRIGVLDQ